MPIPDAINWVHCRADNLSASIEVMEAGDSASSACSIFPKPRARDHAGDECSGFVRVGVLYVDALLKH
eukprot:m.83024 g.83024  ORF g.83024 m.83024 type:complete len:68 (-) comp19595_c0_seq1:132-335(-)